MSRKPRLQEGPHNDREVCWVYAQHACHSGLGTNTITPFAFCFCSDPRQPSRSTPPSSPPASPHDGFSQRMMTVYQPLIAFVPPHHKPPRGHAEGLAVLATVTAPAGENKAPHAIDIGRCTTFLQERKGSMSAVASESSALQSKQRPF